MSMSLGTINSFLGTLQWLWFHIWFIMRLQYIMRQILLQNVTAILLQNATELYQFFLTDSIS